MPNDASLKLPRTLYGYDVISRLGEGAHSVIYAVSDRRSGQVYALKHVVKRGPKDQRYIDQLENEFKVTEKFRHPGLRRCVDFKVKKNLLFQVTEAALVMEMFDGSPLDKQPPKSVSEVLGIFTQVAHALHGLHYLTYVHCDLKPHNIMTNDQGQVKVIDFGQAAKVGTSKERIQGTADFIAPEQVKLRPVTVKTDVFGFGATLYWSLTNNRVPTLFTVSKAERDIVRESRFPSPRELNGEVPEVLSDLVMECVKMNPVGRPEGMLVILEVLDRVKKQIG